MSAGKSKPTDLADLLKQAGEKQKKASKELDVAEKAHDKLKKEGGTRREEIRIEETFERAEVVYREAEQTFQGLKERVTRLRAILDPDKKEDASYVEYLGTDPKKSESAQNPINRTRHASIFDTLIDNRRVCLNSEPAVLVFFNTPKEGVTFVCEGRSGKAQKLFHVHVAEEDRDKVRTYMSQLEAYKKARHDEHLIDELFAPIA